MNSGEQPPVAGARYGRASLVSALVTILALEFLTWVFLLYWFVLPVVVLPAVLFVALVAWSLTRTRGAVAQVGRGMLFGCIAAPLTLLVFIPVYLIAHNYGPV